jgi:hypothetical protein
VAIDERLPRRRNGDLRSTIAGKGHRENKDTGHFSAYTVAMNKDTIIVLAIAAAYPLFLFYIIRYRWRQLLSYHPTAKFQFQITDIWALTIGLALSGAVAVAVIQSIEDTEAGIYCWQSVTLIVLLYVIVTSQIAGAALGHIDRELDCVRGWLFRFGHRPADMKKLPKERSPLVSAVFIVTGSLWGLVLPIVYLFGIWLICASLAVWPITLVVIGVAVLGRQQMKRAKRRKALKATAAKKPAPVEAKGGVQAVQTPEERT